jgi:hypothetical protein
MDIVLHPRAAPADTIRVWIGAFQATGPPELKWFLDGNESEPEALRAIASVRPDDMLTADDEPRAFSGVYDFKGLGADTFHRIAVDADGIRSEMEVRTLPNEVPSSLEGSFNVLLVSCFHQHEDPNSLAGVIASRLKATAKPHLTLLMGDQVYLDLPTLQDFKDDVKWLAAKFENDYTTNWRGSPGYSQVLDCAPSISIPDDHEFWNNYPHPSAFIGNTLTEGGRERWKRAALTVYEGFQLPYPAKTGEPTRIEVAPLSFFIPDMRSLRDPGRAFTMTNEAHQRMNEWVDDVIARQMFGVLVTGQPLFSEPVRELEGSIGDFEMPNYGDYSRIWARLRRLADAGLPALCLTGDVHWGRVVESMDAATHRTAFYEIISSPSSLVTTVGADQFKELGGLIGGLFGKRSPWPRHSDPQPPPDYLAPKSLGSRFVCSLLHGQKGNHVTLLRFNRHGNGLEFRVTFWPISLDSSIGAPQEIGPLQLVRR